MRRPLVGALLLAAGCVPRAHLTVLEASDLRLPEDLRTLGVVERTAAEGDDGAAARAAVEGLVAFLRESPGLDALAGPCGDGVQGVVALEAISSHTRSGLETAERTDVDEAGHETPVTTFTAHLDGQVHTTWTLTTCDGQELDRLEDVVTVDSWSSASDERDAAEGDLPTLGRAITELGFSSGVAYGRRIAPSIDDTVRDYFVRGDPRLRSAQLAVLDGDWTDAASVWRQVAASAEGDRVRARALYDLALAYEVLGNYRLALVYAEEAAATHDSARIRRYRDLLRQLRAERRVLRRGEGSP